MFRLALDFFGIALVLVFFLIFGLLGGYTTKEDGQSFWLGFAIGIFGNIAGILILAYIARANGRSSFEPDFAAHTSEKTSAINKLATLNDRGKLSDQEFERLKNEIIK